MESPTVLLLTALIPIALQTAASESLTPTPANDLYTPTSVIELIGRPDAFQGKTVSVSGYLLIGYRAHLLFPTEQFAEGLWLPNALWLEYDEAAEQRLTPERLSGCYVMIQGVFNGHNKGEAGMHPGSIEQIARLTLRNPDSSCVDAPVTITFKRTDPNPVPRPSP